MNIIEERVGTVSRFEVGASSIIGTRDYQQDFGYCYTDQAEAVAVVCDGMGGLEGGERASKTAVELFRRDFHRERPSQISDFLQGEVEQMDRAVSTLKNHAGKPLKAGTTCVAAYCRKDQMYCLSVGDSKIYLIRKNKILSMNREHNYHLMLQEQLATGKITKEFYDREDKTPQAEALISYIGMGDVKIIDVSKSPINLQAEDIIMLCSDGVYKSLNDSQVHAMVRDNDLDMNIAADRVTAMALRYGIKGQDNTTVILLKYLGK